ncbi:rhodanese-like domain-containing protein [Massilia sp. H-1]|nr:rhodanese-like domain-containing protein [Massilia sp. H-1]
MGDMMNTVKNLSKQFSWLPVALIALALFVHAQMQPRFDVKNISIEEVSALIDSGAVVVDVRGKEAFDARHIPGALNLPLSLLRDGIPAVLASSKALPIVVYCGDGVRIGPEGTSLLNQAGYTNAVNVEKGIQGWADAGRRISASSVN